MNFTVSYSTLMPLTPVMIVALTTIVVMLLISIKRNHNLIATTSVVGLNLAALYILSIYHVLSIYDFDCGIGLLYFVSRLYRNL